MTKVFSPAVCVLVVGSFFLSGIVRAQQVPVVDVAVQPLKSNIRRVLQSLDSLGQPFSQNDLDRIAAALATNSDSKIQQAIDDQVMAVITISPEERVSVRRGNAAAYVQQAGYRPQLIKVINQSTSTSRLRATSPQSGPLYAGTSRLSMQRQQQMQLLENQNVEQSDERFLAIEVYDQQPMTDQLSGLEVEYLILLMGSSETGKREAVLHFDIGDDTADLEHRNELPVLMDAIPAIPVKLQIRDEQGQPSIARLEFRDDMGRVFPMQAKRLAPDFFFQSHIYRMDGEVVVLPPGRFSMQSSRGPEYHVRTREIVVTSEQDEPITIQLERWFDARKYGYFSGDHHIHAAGCAHYTQPTEGVTPHDMFRQVQGEGLNVGCVLTWGPCFDFQRRYFGVDAEMCGTKDTLLKYDLEISGFGSQALGHVCLLNLKNQTYPGSEGTKTKGWPTWTTPVMRWAKEQGGYAGYAHSASGLWIDPENAVKRMIATYDRDSDGSLDRDEADLALLPDLFVNINSDRDSRLSRDELVSAHRAASEQLPNYAIPEMNGVGAMEICVSTVAGVCDFISAMDTRRIQEWNTWYHLLNCGFPLKVSGETDFPCMSSRRVGKGRVYVHLGKEAELNFEQWCEALADGRSYVSDGYAHLPVFSINGQSMGDDVRLDRPGSVTIKAQMAFSPRTPEAVAYGTQESDGGRAVVGDTVVLHRDRSESWIDWGERKVEIIVNGQVVATSQIPADGSVHVIEQPITIDQSSWIAIRQFPQLHSNPINVIIDDKPIRASADSARWCIEMTELLWKNRGKGIAANERDEARQAFDHALDVLAQIYEESMRLKGLGTDGESRAGN
ncbi:MAG: CehA/McbA family metallohydrolase [Planctomycetota bacterium]